MATSSGASRAVTATASVVESFALPLLGVGDVVLAGEDCSFSFPEVKRGLIPGLVSFSVRRRMSDVSCRSMMLSAEEVDSYRARELGLVDIVSADVGGAVEELLASLSAAGPALLTRCKCLMPCRSLEESSLVMGQLVKNTDADFVSSSSFPEIVDQGLYLKLSQLFQNI